MTELTPNELELHVELQQTRMALFKKSEEAAKMNAELMRVAQRETATRLKALMGEQERRDTAAQNNPVEQPTA